MSTTLEIAKQHLQTGHLTEAETLYQHLLQQHPQHPESLHFLGVIAARRGNHEQAIDYMKQSLLLQPHSAGFHNNLGNVLRTVGRLEEAMQSYHTALRLTSQGEEVALAYNNLGICVSQQDDLETAITYFRHALQLQPADAGTYNNLGVALKQQGCLTEAVDSFQQALQYSPNFIDALENLGSAWEALDKMEEAGRCYQQVIETQPDNVAAHCHYYTVLLRTGQFAQGWREYLWRYRPSSPQVTILPTTLQGQRVLLNREQGLGDEIFFLRFALLLKARGAWLAYRGGKKIASILQRQPWLDHWLEESQEANFPVDHSLLIGDLPVALEMDSIEKVPPPLPLSVLPKTVEKLHRQLVSLGPPPYIGVTWRAGTAPEKSVKSDSIHHSLYKEVTPEVLAEILRPLPATVLILQRHPTREDLARFSQTLGRHVHDLSALNETLEEMLALLFLLHDYIGVSNTNMHLRAGLGKTARVLVPHPPEWRWMVEGKESPWFRGFTVYRQTVQKEWGEALRALRRDLEAKFLKKVGWHDNGKGNPLKGGTAGLEALAGRGKLSTLCADSQV